MTPSPRRPYPDQDPFDRATYEAACAVEGIEPTSDDELEALAARLMDGIFDRPLGQPVPEPPNDIWFALQRLEGIRSES